MNKLVIALIIMIATAFAGNIESNGIDQGDLFTLLDNMQENLQYHIYANADVATGSASTTLSIGTAIEYVNNGIVYDLGTTNAISLNATVLSSLAAVKHSYSAARPAVKYMLSVNSAGAYKLNRSQGTYQPPMVSTYTPLSTLLVTLDSDNTAGFLPGTTNWDALSQNVTIEAINTLSTGSDKVKLIGL